MFVCFLQRIRCIVLLSVSVCKSLNDFLSQSSLNEEIRISVCSLSGELISVFIVGYRELFNYRRTVHCLVEPVQAFNGTFRCSWVPIESERRSCGNALLSDVHNHRFLWEISSPSCARQIAIKRGFMVCKLVYMAGVSALLVGSIPIKTKPPPSGEFLVGMSRHVLEILLFNQIKKRCHRDT